MVNFGIYDQVTCILWFPLIVDSFFPESCNSFSLPHGERGEGVLSKKNENQNSASQFK